MMHITLFLSVYCLGIILTFFSNPVFSFVLYQVVYFFNPADRWWSYGIPGFKYSFFTVVLMFFSVFVLYRKHQFTNKLLTAPPFKWMYLMGFLYGVTYFYAVLPDWHLDAAINYIKLIIIISLAYKLIDTPIKLDYALWGYIFGSWYIGFLTWQTGRNAGDRVEGIGTVDSPDSNGIAAAIAPSVVVCLYYFWINNSKILKLAFAVAGVFIANALVLINSRGAILGAGMSIIMFMYYMYFSQSQRKHQKATAMALTIIGLAGALYIVDDSFIERIRSMGNYDVEVESESGATRTVFWLTSLDVAWDHPIGAGYRTFDYYAPQYLPEDLDTGVHRYRSVHSTWFETLTEMGYLGFFFMIMMIYSCLKSVRRCLARLIELEDLDNYFKVLAIQSACFAFIIAMSFMNRFRAEILYWLVLFTASAYNIYVLKAYEKKSAISQVVT